MESRVGSRRVTRGEFGRRCGLSVKALRLYELSGLLLPAGVDPANGYRWYGEDQVEKGRLIALMRAMDVPLALVGELVAGPPEVLVEGVEHWWAARCEEVRSRGRVLEELRRCLGAGRGGGRPVREVGVRRAGRATVVSVRREADQGALVGVLHECDRWLRGHLAGQGAVASPETWLVYHGCVTPDGAAPVEVAVPFTGVVEPEVGIAVGVEPERGEAVCAVRRRECHYPRILECYEAVRSWVRERSMVVSGPVREVYTALGPHWGGAGEGDVVARVALPVRGVSDGGV
ncbi:MerR family transcriptional regulator [Nocardiopsis sp. LOL_012]|uniref:MerR family transcriptional regulator n=1 Tax=Nocardiopsis sp. LOL_012 TaxID=3345409 RepID=UPI003A844608